MDDIFSQVFEMKKMYSNWIKGARKVLNRELEKKKQKEEQNNKENQENQENKE